MCVKQEFELPELMELEVLDPGPPRPRPELEPRPLLPLREPLSSPPVPRGRCSLSFTSSGSEVLDNSECVPGSSTEMKLMTLLDSKPISASNTLQMVWWIKIWLYNSTFMILIIQIFSIRVLVYPPCSILINRLKNCSHQIQSADYWRLCVLYHGSRSYELCGVSCCCHPSGSLCPCHHRGHE